MILLKRFLNILYDREEAAKTFPLLALFTGSILFWELLLRGVLLSDFFSRLSYVILFSLFFGAAFTLVTSLFGRTGGKVVLWVSLAVLYFWYAAQLIYYKIFGGFISVYLIAMGGDAVTNFFKETLDCVLRSWWLLAIMAIPFAVAAIALRKKKLVTFRHSVLCIARQTVLCILIHLAALGCLGIEGTGTYTVYDVYHNPNTSTDSSVATLGILTTFRLELQSMLRGGETSTEPGDDPVIEIPVVTVPVITVPVETQPDETGPDTTVPDETIPTEPPVVYEDQVLQIDFDALIADAQASGNSTIASLHQYFASVAPTRTNEYTGLFEGYNLIYMVCESFSPEVISPELTPTLYKLYTEGIQFSNFYGTYRNVTTNGEYTACLGIFPDLSRSKSDGSFEASADNYLPFALGNIFRSQLDVASYGYHNYLGSYYSRKYSHPNMGYSCKFMNSGMKFTYAWPSSDYEMMQQSVADYVSNEQFHAYYMTFSGHYQYSFENNPMCRINQDKVADLSYSQAVKAYIACHLELEKAMAYLMEQLEAAGQLENTVIVMTSDHYPYGLSEKQYSELAGETKDGVFGIYENAFICWASGVDIQVDTPCCTVDILPTLLNLFGFEYDSRLLAGRDVLDPDAQHIAILYNGSFITDTVMFNSANGKVTYLVDESLIPEGYVEALVQTVQNRFTISTAILNNDYYRIVLSPDA